MGRTLQPHHPLPRRKPTDPCSFGMGGTLQPHATQPLQKPTDPCSSGMGSTLQPHGTLSRPQPTDPCSSGMGGTLQPHETHLSHNQLTRVPLELGALSNLTILDLSHNQLTRVPPEWGALSNLTETLPLSQPTDPRSSRMGRTLQPRDLWLHHNNLQWIPRCMGNMDTLKTLKTHDNPRLCYPPADLKDPIEYLKNHKDTVSPWGRLKHAWGGIRLMWIASKDSGCSTTFGRLPVEVIVIIRRFILADPYLETPE